MDLLQCSRKGTGEYGGSQEMERARARWIDPKDQLDDPAQGGHVTYGPTN